ncbi:major capsid protein [Chromohalobacter canadensis]|uniref:major capsid protein n=1 Tax=Chromohalobacter canadensis TaxID=141389 RepID=UPI00241027A1|nr:major capsid protein [Chromohalobacter canadensis]
MSILNNTEVVDQTNAINKIKPLPGLFGALGLYRAEMVGTDAITFDVRDNSLHVLEDHLRNVSEKNVTGERPYDVHTMALPHYPVTRTIGRERLAGIRGFNQQSEQTVAQAVAEELEVQVEHHELHLEYLQALMTLTGQVETEHFGTINMASEFGVSRPTQALNDGSLTADLRAAQRASKAGLTNGGRIGGYILFAGVEMFDHIVGSSDVREAYQFDNSGNNPLRLELGTVANGYSMFQMGNVSVVQYDDSFQKADGSTVDVLAPEAGVLVPRTKLGRAFFGPESTLGGLGNGGARRFARSFRDPRDRYVEVSSEQNSLIVAEQFGATVELSIGTAA